MGIISNLIQLFCAYEITHSNNPIHQIWCAPGPSKGFLSPPPAPHRQRKTKEKRRSVNRDKEASNGLDCLPNVAKSSRKKGLTW